jgi:3-hydroxyisobutyrate dehydrogenase-like beta-hydroxyacid dehydrogenase
MGSRIAGRFLDGGHRVLVWNRDETKARPLAERGAIPVSNPGGAAREAEFVVTMVASPKALADVTEGPDGIAAGVSASTTVAQMSTVGPDDVARLASLLPPGAGFLDAPVLGSLTEVELSALRIFAGGQAELVERWTPLLSELGTVMHVGAAGAGTAAKLVVNSTLLGTLSLLGEALALAEALGLSRDTAFEVLEATPLAAQAERRRAAFESGNAPVRFTLALARKDAELINEAAGGGADLRLLAAVRSWFTEADAAGLGDRDYSAVLERITERRDSD